MESALLYNLEKDVDNLVDELQAKLAMVINQTPEPSPPENAASPPPQPTGPSTPRAPFGVGQSWSGFIGEKPGGGGGKSPNPTPSNSQPRFKPIGNMPRWKGLRGLGRWLWKGYSPDNPDYQHLYQREHTSLREYINKQNRIDEQILSFANEILDEAVGPAINQQNPMLAKIFNDFKMAFKQLVRTYIDQMPKPEAKPEQSLAKGDTEVLDDTPDDDIAAAYAQDSKKQADAAAAKAAEEQEAERQLADMLHNKKENNRDTGFDEALKNVKEGKIEEPSKDWLTAGNRLKQSKLAHVVAWLINKAKNEEGQVGVNIFSPREVRNALAKINFQGSGNIATLFAGKWGLKPKDPLALERIFAPLGWKHGNMAKPKPIKTKPIPTTDGKVDKQAATVAAKEKPEDKPKEEPNVLAGDVDAEGRPVPGGKVHPRVSGEDKPKEEPNILAGDVDAEGRPVPGGKVHPRVSGEDKPKEEPTPVPLPDGKLKPKNEEPKKPEPKKVERPFSAPNKLVARDEDDDDDFDDNDDDDDRSLPSNHKEIVANLDAKMKELFPRLGNGENRKEAEEGWEDLKKNLGTRYSLKDLQRHLKTLSRQLPRLKDESYLHHIKTKNMTISEKTAYYKKLLSEGFLH